MTSMLNKVVKQQPDVTNSYTGLTHVYYRNAIQWRLWPC